MDSSGRVISPKQTLLPEKTKQSKETDIIPPVGLEPIIPAYEWPQIYALVRAATGIGFQFMQFETFYLIDESNVFKCNNFVN